MGRLSFKTAICQVILLLTLAPGFADDPPMPIAANRKTAEWVIQSGGHLGLSTDAKTALTVRKLADLPKSPFTITRVDFGGQRRITNEDLTKLGSLEKLEELNLSYTRLTDAGLKSLDKLPALKRLYLSETKLTDASLRPLAQLSNLASLDLSGTKITDKNLSELEKLPKLTRLFLARTQTTDNAVEHLANLSQLTVLHLTGVNLEAEEIAKLSELKDLKELSVTVSDPSLPKLGELSHLKILTVHGSGVSDHGMPNLAKLSQLEQLRLSHTGISEFGLNTLKTSLTNCQIMAHPISRQSAFLMANGPGLRPVMRWLPGDSKEAWMGIVPRPAQLPSLPRWQLETIEPRSEIRSVDFSPNGQRVACGTASGYLRIYDANNLSLVALIPAHRRGVHSVAWSPDGTQLASGGADSMVRIWNPEGNPLHVLRGHRNSVMCIQWSPDGQRLASGSWDNSMRIWKPDGLESVELKGHKKAVCSIAWSPDGKQIASGSNDKTIRLWDLTGKTLQTMEGHTDMVSSLAWSSRGSRLASGSWDHTIRFWNPRTGRGGPVLEGHTYRVYDLEWHPEGTMLASSGDRTLRLWTMDGTPVRTVKTEADDILTLSWKHDGNEIVTGTRQTSILRITKEDGKSDRAIGEDLNGGAVKIAWHPGGDRIALGCRDRLIRLITEDGRMGAVLSGHYYHVRALDWSPTGERLASSGDSVVRIWNQQGVPLREIKESKHGNNTLDWSPDGTAIAVVSRDGTARVFSPDGKKQTEVKLPKTAREVKWGPDSQSFVTMSDSDVRMWNRDGTPGPVLADPPRSLVTLDWNYTTDQIAVGGWSHQFQTWSAEGERGVSPKMAQSILDIAFAPKGDQIAMAWFNNSLAFTKADGSEAQVVPAHAGPLTSVSWHPNGKTVASCAHDNTLRFWDANTHAPKHVMLIFHDGTSATITAAGQLQNGDVSVLGDRLVYLIEEPSGNRKILSPSEFEDRLTRPIPTTAKNTPATKNTEAPNG